MAARMLWILLVVHRAVPEVLQKKQADKLLMQELQEELMLDNADYDALKTNSINVTTITPATTTTTATTITQNTTKPTCYQVTKSETTEATIRYYRNRFKIITPSTYPQPSTRRLPEFRGKNVTYITGAQKYPIFRRKTKTLLVALITKSLFKFKAPLQQSTGRSSVQVHQGPVFRSKDLDNSKEFAKITVYRHRPTTRSTTVTAVETFLTNSLPKILIHQTQERRHKRPPSITPTTLLPENIEKSEESLQYKTYASPTINRIKLRTTSARTMGLLRGGRSFGRFRNRHPVTKANTDLEEALKGAVSRALARVAEHKKHNYEFNFNSSMRRADYLRWKYAQGVI